MKSLRESTNKQAQFLWSIFRDAFHYIAIHGATIADNARDIDFAMRWGFGWNVGPFETWQASGWQQVATWVKEDIDAGKALCATPLPAWVFEGPVAEKAGVHTQKVLGLSAATPSHHVQVWQSTIVKHSALLYWVKAQQLALPPA